MPTNAEETALSLDPDQALEEFATKLAGTEVEIQEELAAALANLEYSWRNGQVNRGSSS